MGNGEIRARFRKEDVKALREQLQVGDEIGTELRYDKLGERLMAPIRMEHRVVAKYPHLVELDGRTGKRRTATYIDILLGQVEGGEDNV